MRTFPFVTLDVFTDRRFGGNPLAVFTDARGIADDEMQALAAELNLSETTFVLPPADAANTARVRIFNRTTEMPFAGHPTVGTGVALAQMGRDRGGKLRLEVPAGIVEVEIERDGDGAPIGGTIAAPQPLALGLQVPEDVIAACAGLSPAAVVVKHHQPCLATVGNPYIIAEVTAAALPRAVPQLPAFREAAQARPELNGRFSLYLYARDGERLRVRMFAPLAGTIEDPATGSAATPLAALLLSLSGAERAAYTISQGTEIGRPSLLHATAFRAADGIRATVGGRCVPVLRGEAQL